MTNDGTPLNFLSCVSYIPGFRKEETRLVCPAFPKWGKGLGGTLRFPAQQNQIGTIQQILRAAIDNSLNIIELSHCRSRRDASLVTQRIDLGGRFDQLGIV